MSKEPIDVREILGVSKVETEIKSGLTDPCKDSAYTDDMKEALGCNVNKDATVGGVANGIIGWVISAVGIVAILVMVFGGVLMAAAQGDPGKFKKGRDAVLYGVIGLLIVVLAYAIVALVTGIL